MRKALILTLLALSLLVSCRRSATVTEVRVVPEPLFAVQRDGTFALGANPRLSLAGVGQNSPTVKYILTSMRHAHLHPKLVATSERTDFDLVINDTLNPELGDEGYLLEVRSNGIRLSANTETGLFYAYQSLVQMLPPDVSRRTYSRILLPECTILDKPRFPHRALVLDTGHRLYSTKELRKIIDLMACYKLNHLQLHVVDGNYSRADILDLIAYAANRAIDIVPELALVPTIADSVSGAELCLGDDPGLDSVGVLLDVVADLFPSPLVHIGGGEPDLTHWRTCPRCQHLIRTLHLPSESALYEWFMSRVESHLDSLGKQAAVWSDGRVVGMTTAALAVVTGPPEQAEQAARRGNPVVYCPSTLCDFDAYQADRRYQPVASPTLLTLRQAYTYDPAPSGLNLRVAEKVVGGQCHLWADHLASAADAEYMLLPRLLATAEAVWSAPQAKSWNRFRLKVEQQKPRLAAKGYTYCEGSFMPQFSARRVDDQTMSIAISTEVPSTYIFYTTDSTTPTRQSPIYIGPINLRRGTHIKILPVYKDIERDSVYEFVIK